MKTYGMPTKIKVQRSIKIAEEDVRKILTDRAGHGMYIVSVPEAILEKVALQFALLEWELYGGAIACPQYKETILRSSYGEDLAYCARCHFAEGGHETRTEVQR